MKTTLTETIETLEETLENCKCDLKSDWIENDQKSELQIDLTILRQAIGLLSDLKNRGCDQFFNNIRK